MRLFLRFCGLIAVCVAISTLASGEVSAQSFFERLFGTGDPRPQQPIVNEQRRSPVGIRLERMPDDRVTRVHEPRSHSMDAADSGDVVQSMCVRTCDGFYWPVRFPVARRDLKQDANICESTCGTQAKLYTRAGPGVEAEEMKDADGASYGASATAFAYRRGLVNGCACRPMPWSAAERARHEGYALAEAEKAIRIAQAEAEASAGAVAKAELERVAAFPVAPAEAAIAGLRGTVGDGGVPVGPAEAAAIAAFTAADRAPNTATDEVLVRRSSRQRARGLELESSTRRTVRSASPRRRNAQVATVGWGF